MDAVSVGGGSEDLMHFIASLFFLLLAILLTFAYLAFGYFILLGLSWVWQRLKVEANRTRLTEEDIKVKINKKVLLFLGVASASICLFVYFDQWAEWKTDENAHLEAKNYFIAGQVVYGIRTIMTDVLHPDNPILFPANSLQKWIYHAGVKLLPKDDGEKAIWMDLWFVYPYSKKMRDPYLTDEEKPSPRMIEFLDRIWWTIETVAQNPIADLQMKTKHYYRNFPRMLFYYCLNEGFYAGKFRGSRKPLSKMPIHRKRSELIVHWIYSYKDQIENNSQKSLLKENPKIEALLQVSLILELHDLFHADLWGESFSCGKPYVDQLVTAINDFGAGSNGELPAYQRMKDKAQAETLYHGAIDNISSRFVMFSLHKFCNKEFFFSEYQILRTRRNTNLSDTFETLYKNELGFLKEIRHVK
jgi:hypothetical protein